MNTRNKTFGSGRSARQKSADRSAQLGTSGCSVRSGIRNNFEKNILVAFLIKLVFFVVEFVGALLTNSMAVLSDSIHGLGDVMSVGLSFFLEKKSKKKVDDKHTYGYARYSVLGGAIMSMVLIASAVAILFESAERVISPEEIDYGGMIVLALIGIVMNAIATYVTHGGKSLNQKSVSLHMLGDVLSWGIVLMGAVIMKFTEITVIDPILSIAMAVFILVRALKFLKEAVDVFLDKVPVGVDVAALRKAILRIDGVRSVHHMHVRSIDGYKTEATLHVVVSKYSAETKQMIREEFARQDIRHVMVEMEVEGENCRDEKCGGE